jgi:hypothetical protein
MEQLLLLRSTRIGETVAAEFLGLTWVELFRPLSGILSVIEAVTEAEGVEGADTPGEGPLATPPPDDPDTLSEDVEACPGFEPPAPVVVPDVDAELLEPETGLTDKLFRAIKRARTANKWSLLCTYRSTESFRSTFSSFS